MRTSTFPLHTLKEIPADAEIISHKLMLRAGLIRKLAAGLYTWMPLGLRILRKVENIIRDEMNNAGAIELLMPSIQPAELWQESGRWEQYGPELLRIQDRHSRDFCYGPTHEEIITDLVRREIRSYKQLPVNFYQIQTKFRDEIRPRFGVMRSREFIMKDAYSFHLNADSLQQTYELMYETYTRIFTRLGLEFRAVLADTGSIGGNASHEFHVLADSGEDAIAFSSDSDFAANVELAETFAQDTPRTAPLQAMTPVDTPDQHTIAELGKFLGIPEQQCLKTLLVQGENNDVVALVLRGDHELNPIKAEKLPGVATPLTFATDKQIQASAGCPAGSLGPVNLSLVTYVDHAAAQIADFVCGANQDGKHLAGVNWGRDLPEPDSCDLRCIQDGDPSPDGNGTVSIVRGIEVGHIFQLGSKYSEAMNTGVLDESGKQQIVTMGCYGIGVTRIVAAAIEQNHDDKGIIWPASISPFQVALIPINLHKSARLKDEAEALYNELKQAGIDTLFDDRPLRPGIMFADMELTGIPHRFVISDRGLESGEIEYKSRTGDESRQIPRDNIIEFLTSTLNGIANNG